jgi:hypothetical protein
MKTEDEIGCRARGRLEETNSLEGFSLTEAFVSDTFRIFSILRNHWKRVSTLRIPGENGIHKAEEVNAVQAGSRNEAISVRDWIFYMYM